MWQSLEGRTTTSHRKAGSHAFRILAPNPKVPNREAVCLVWLRFGTATTGSAPASLRDG